MRHSQVAVKLREDKRHHIHPQKGGQNVEGAVSGRIALLHVEKTEVIDGDAGEGVANAGVQHEDEAVLLAQRSSAQDAENHRAREQSRTGGKHQVVNKYTEISRTCKVNRERNGEIYTRHTFVCRLGDPLVLHEQGQGGIYEL